MQIYRTRNRAKKPVIVPIGPGIAYVTLTHELFALIDSEDTDMLGKYNWSARIATNGCWYALANERGDDGKWHVVYMHRLVLGVTSPHTDHIHHRTLDNRKSQLREATIQQNACNKKKSRESSSTFKGVSWHKKSGKWQARCMVNGVAKHLGLFDSEKDGHDAYCEAAKSLHKEFSCTG